MPLLSLPALLGVQLAQPAADAITFAAAIPVCGTVLRTLPLAMQTIAGGVASAAVSRAGATAAGTFLMIIPTVLIFLLMQKQVIYTMVHSGLKG